MTVSSAGHPLLDGMWRLPEIFLRPFLGLAFPEGTTTLSEWWTFNTQQMPNSPPEILGGIVLLAFVISLYRHKLVLRFVQTGTVRCTVISIPSLHVSFTNPDAIWTVSLTSNE